jgi:hypothetical protein
MRLLELWRLSRVVYKEVSFQSIFSLRSGGILSQRDNASILRLVKSAELNILVNKALTTIFMLVFAAVIFLPHPFKTTYVRVPDELSITGDVSAFLSVVLFMITIMGLQVTTAFVSSDITSLLAPLPLSKSDISKVIFLCFLRMFDLPLISAAAIFVLNYGILRKSLLGFLSSFLSIITTEIFALALTVALSSFFYYKVSSGDGRTKWRSLLRLAFTIVWILPALGTYFVANFATQIAQSFILLAQIFSPVAHLLVLLYPFSFGFLVSSSTLYEGIDMNISRLSLFSSIAYVVLASFSLKWVLARMKGIGTPRVHLKPGILTKDVNISPKSPLFGIIQKDFRIASRSPSYSSLFFMPAVQTAVLAISFSSLGEMKLSISIGILIGVSIVTLLIPPTLFSMEDIGCAYTRSLPINRRTLITAKTAVSLFSYGTSFLSLMAVAAITRIDFWGLMMLGVAHIFSIAAASIMELMMLLKEFYEKGISLGNLYLRLYAYVPIVLLGMGIAIVPLMTALVLQQVYSVQEESTIFILLFPSMSEFIVSTFLFLRESG